MDGASPSCSAASAACSVLCCGDRSRSRRSSRACAASRRASRSRELLRTNFVHVLIGCLLLAGTGCFNGLFFSHLPGYLSGVLKYDPRQAVLAQTVGVIASAIGILVTGWLGDRIPPRHLLRAGVGLLLVFPIAFYSALEARAMNLTLLCVLAGLSAGLTNGSFAVLLTDLFPTRVRFTGVALVFNVSFTIFSGTAPLVATTLIRDTGQAIAPAYMMMASAALALIGSIWVDRFGGNVLSRR